MEGGGGGRGRRRGEGERTEMSYFVVTIATMNDDVTITVHQLSCSWNN